MVTAVVIDTPNYRTRTIKRTNILRLAVARQQPSNLVLDSTVALFNRPIERYVEKPVQNNPNEFNVYQKLRKTKTEHKRTLFLPEYFPCYSIETAIMISLLGQNMGVNVIARARQSILAAEKI